MSLTVIKNIICELTGYRPGTVDVSQGDRGSRAVSCRLMENGAPWMIPEGATARVAYTLPDGTEGLHDRRPDGSPMWEISGNTVTVELADQLMAQAGMVQMSILILGPEGGQLATWPIRVTVSANKAARLTVPEEMPPYGAGFAGKIFFGGADGTVTPLGIGDGVEIVRQEDGTFALVAYGGAGGGGGIVEEKDPTVAEWAKVGQARPYGPENAPPYPVTSVNGKAGAVVLGAEDVGADPTGAAAGAVGAHNVSGEAHGDIRQELAAINARLTAFFDSDDQTLDELSEIVAYITSNKSLIDAITTSKVSVADIVNDLTTSVANKPLSAAQGALLKNLHDLLENRMIKGLADKLDATALPAAVEDALAQAKANGEFDGADGNDGLTPHIGANGNWWIGDADTGVRAQGPQGPAYELTNEDRKDIVHEVLTGLPVWTGGAY